MTGINHTRYTLIQRVKDRYDEAAWKEFVDIYERYIYVVIRKMEIDAGTSEDLTQSILIKLWKKLPELDFNPEIARFRTWLSRVIYNAVVDHVRSVKRSPGQVELDENHGIGPQINQMMDEEWENYIANLALQRIQASFKGHALEVFEMIISGIGPAKIAAKLGIQQASVRKLKNRVKARLKNEIAILRQDLG